MLQRLALAPAPDEFAKSIDFRRRERALEIQVQAQARLLEQVRQQHFRLQTGRVHALFGQEPGAALNGFQDRHAEIG